MNVIVKPARINITLLSPEESIFNPGDEVAFTLKAYYPDGSIVEKAGVSLNVPQGKVVFKEINGVYNVTYLIPQNFSGTWNARLIVTDVYGNTGEFKKNILVKTPPIILHPLVLLSIFVLVILVIVFFYFGGLKFVRVLLLEHYESKQKDLKRMQDITQKKYFERMIDEETYMELMRKHEARLVSVQTSIKELKKKLGIKTRGGKRKSVKKK